MGTDIALSRKHDIDRHCAVYVASCKAAKPSAAYRDISFITDKGESGSLPYQFSATIFSDNVAYMNIPQV